jgi:hypothetical protein
MTKTKYEGSNVAGDTLSPLTTDLTPTFDHEAFLDSIRATGTRVPDYTDECPHDELDHGICLDCGADRMDDMVAAAEFRADCLEDR